ncbi:DUF4129 domain-containing protein [Candidatus Poribacteria bacterium]|nr:DUF4129 domain-containing protein [Candidatus Poribacteria bacterium]
MKPIRHAGRAQPKLHRLLFDALGGIGSALDEFPPAWTPRQMFRELARRRGLTEDFAEDAANLYARWRWGGDSGAGQEVNALIRRIRAAAAVRN